MKKLLSLLLAVSMVCIMMAGCAKKDAAPAASDEKESAATAEEGEAEATPAAAADISVAMITDYGDITDQSFNQTTYEACKAF